MKIAGIKFKDYGPVYYFSCAEVEVQPGDRVVVETQEGPGLAQWCF